MSGLLVLFDPFGTILKAYLKQTSMSSALSLMITAKSLCKKYHISPSKVLGQNFLIDRKALKKLITESELKPSDIVLEIGPGLGILTKELSKTAKKVLAIEKDLRIIRALEDELTADSIKNVEIIQGDIIKILDSRLMAPNTYNKVVANLPFYLTSAVIRKLLEGKNQPEAMTLLIQKEVAQRISSHPPRMNLLALSVQFYAKPKIAAYLSKNSFWPKPTVESAIIKITPNKELRESKKFRDLFFRIARAGFSRPRKQLTNNLSEMLKLDKERIKGWLLENKIKPEQRAESLTLTNWTDLAKTFNDK